MAYHASTGFIGIICIVFAEQVAAEPRDFLRKVSVQEVETDLQTALSDLLSGTSKSTSKRLAVIETSAWQTFQALPKNAAGRLAPPAVRYIVHGYFAREHGWLIKGLEPHGMQLNVTAVHDVSILQDKAPILVEGLLEARQSDRGLSFNDIVTMVAVLEQMMFDESVTLLQAAYHLNSLSPSDHVDDATLHKVLQSYLILFAQGSKADLVDVDRFQAILRLKTSPEMIEFEHDTVLNFQYAHRNQINPFATRRYSFQAAADIMADLAQQYGKWQNSECRDMKAHLAELDPEGNGRIPLGLFYAQPAGSGLTSSFHFSESVDYLRTIGALDETSPENPKVLAANYVAGPSNCIASSSYYSVCCLSECTELFDEIERHVAAPSASPEKLLDLVDKISDTVLASGLREKLQSIAGLHGGEVPLYGRLFAQWLHFAFPHECPFPSIVESATALTASQWFDAQSVVSVEEMQRHISSATVEAQDFHIDERWSDHEVLPVQDSPDSSLFQFASGTMRIVVQLVAVCVALRSALAAFRTTTASRDKKAKKDDDYIFGFSV